MMIVDCHVNIFNADQFSPPEVDLSGGARPGGVAMAADADTLYSAMSEVDKAIIFSLRYKDSVGVDGNDEVTAEAVAKYPDKFVGFACVDPRRPDYMELLEHAIGTLKLKGVKFGPIYNSVPLDDPRLDPVYAYCQKNDVPLTMHMGTTFARDTLLDAGRPLHVDAVAQRYPDLKMIMAHMGHPWVDECIVVARKRPNVYTEVSALCYRPWQFYQALVSAQEYLITDRNKIFWGTDFPFAQVGESIEGLRNINRLVEGTPLPKVSQETIDAILHSNPFDHWWHSPLSV